MRTVFLFMAMFCSIATLQSQDYKISFAGSGSATVVETVKVKNLTQGTTLNLSGSDVLHLLKTLGIGSPGQGISGALTINHNLSRYFGIGTIEHIEFYCVFLLCPFVSIVVKKSQP